MPPSTIAQPPVHIPCDQSLIHKWRWKSLKVIIDCGTREVNVTLPVHFQVSGAFPETTTLLNYSTSRAFSRSRQIRSDITDHLGRCEISPPEALGKRRTHKHYAVPHGETCDTAVLPRTPKRGRMVENGRHAACSGNQDKRHNV